LEYRIVGNVAQKRGGRGGWCLSVASSWCCRVRPVAGCVVAFARFLVVDSGQAMSMSTVHYRGSGVQIEISQDDSAPDRIHVISRFFRSFGTSGARQQVFFEGRKLGFVYDQAQVVPFQIVVGNVVHACIVVRPGKSSQGGNHLLKNLRTSPRMISATVMDSDTSAASAITKRAAFSNSDHFISEFPLSKGI
jgi:hypothetical protein